MGGFSAVRHGNGLHLSRAALISISKKKRTCYQQKCLWKMQICFAGKPRMVSGAKRDLRDEKASPQGTGFAKQDSLTRLQR
jgi:hypothetical protein